MHLTAHEFQHRFLRLIALSWLLPPMVGFAFLLYIEFFRFDQLVPMITNPLELGFIVIGFLLALIYFRHFSQPLTSYLNAPDQSHKADAEQALKRFPSHFWLAFSIYIILAPAITVISLEISTDYTAHAIDWFRIHLVALIVSIIVGLPIFISIYDLFGKAFGPMEIQRPVLTIKTRVFLIGALIPLLIDTMLVQYYWTRTGFFSIETFFIWLLLECLAIAGTLLFVRSFNQSLSPLKSLINTPLDSLNNNIQAASIDELGIFTNQLKNLLNQEQLNQRRLAFSNDLLKAAHNYESLARLLEMVVNRTSQTLHGDVCFLSLFDKKKQQLICVAHSNAGYKAEGHFQISLDETSIHVDVFRSSKPRIIDNVPNDPNSHAKLKKAFNVKSSAAVPLRSDNKTIGVLQVANTHKIHHYNEQEIKILQAFAQEAATIQNFFENLKKRHKAESAITQIMEAVSTSTGADFFNAISRHMADILQADSCGIVTTLAESQDNVETLSYFYDGEIIDNAQYPLQGTPCETIIGQQARSYPKNIQKEFPHDPHLCQTGMESYVGIPLFDSKNQPLGLLFAMFRAPIEDTAFNESVMRIFATRTAAEIERTRTEKRIKHMAYYDELTDLPNRAYLMDRLQQAIAHAQRHENGLAVMMLDLDHFKKINDSLGHPIGDGLLVEVAHRLQDCIRKEDTVARLGGDEFVILIADFDKRESSIHLISQIAEQIHQTIKQHYTIADHSLMITSSCGIALYPENGDSVDLLIKHADTALYKAKEKGRDNFQFFSDEMNIAAMERLHMESEIHKAIAEQQFDVAYQPKVSVKDNSIIGAEILLRWNHPQQGDIPPEKFIPIADETGQIIQLGDYIFQQACKKTSEFWCNSQCCDEIYSLSVNVSPRQFKQDDFVDKIKQTLQQYNTRPSCIELEITENVLIDDTDKARQKLQALRDLGLKISIDDFGTGYASLRYLQQLPISMIKIDRSFISHINNRPGDLAIVKTILTMAQNLNIKVIAEGVENPEQLQLLNELGCEFYQGYLFSEPVGEAVFRRMVEGQREC